MALQIAPGLTWERHFQHRQTFYQPNVYWVPDTVDGTDTSDMTSAINTWIGTVPNGSTLMFKPGATYRIEGTLKPADGSAGLTFNGNGSTFHCHAAPTESQPMWNANDCQNISLQNMKLTASYASPGTYTSAVEHAHAIDFRGVVGFYIDSIVMTNFAGDGIYLGLGLTGAQTLTTGMTDQFGQLVPSITNCTMNGSGRNVVSYVACQNVLTRYVTGNTIGLYGFDVEPNALPGFAVSNVTVDRCTLGTVRSYTMSIIENAPISNITFSNNTTNDANGFKLQVSNVLANPVQRPQNITITGNSCPTQYSNPATFYFTHVDGLTVTGNAIPMWCSDPVKTYMAVVNDCTSAVVSGNDISVFAGPHPPPSEVAFQTPAPAGTPIWPGLTFKRRFYDTRTAAISVPPPGASAASATGSVDLEGTVGAAAAAIASGSLTLGGTATAQAAVSAAGSISLAGSAVWTEPSAGSITLAGSAAASAAVTAVGSITLAGSAVQSSKANGSITLGGTTVWTEPAAGSITLGGSAVQSSTASGSVTLAGAAAWTEPASGSVTLGGTVTARAAVTAAGSVTLGGTATWTEPSAGSITLGGTATARAPVTAAGSVTLGGIVTNATTANGSVTLGTTAAGNASVTVAGSVALAGTVTARAAGTASGSVTLGSTVTAQATLTATGGVSFGSTANAAARSTVTGSITLAGAGTATGAPSGGHMHHHKALAPTTVTAQAGSPSMSPATSTAPTMRGA